MKKKTSDHFFFVLSSVTYLRRKFFRLFQVFWPILWSYKIICASPKRLLKTQIFEKKATFPMKKISWPIILVVSNMRNVGIN